MPEISELDIVDLKSHTCCYTGPSIRFNMRIHDLEVKYIS